MLAALRPYVTAGVALVGSSLIAVTPMTRALPDLPVEHLSTRLLATSSSIANVPYNVIADIVNIPYNESLALEEYAYALGPAGSTGGVPGWVPPGATVKNGGAVPVNPADPNSPLLYTLGGTGSWYMESIGNTWGWDDGNWPQVAALFQVLLPFQFTEPIAAQVQTFAQAELTAGAAVNCEFECANVLGYLGGWLSFPVPLTSLLSGTTFPTVLADTIGANFPGAPGVPGVINVGPGSPNVIWSGQPAQLNLLVPLQAVVANLTGSPANNPIMLPNLANVLASATQLSNDINYDFSPFVTGSFLYWGAPTLYSVPAGLAGLLQNFTGIPNQFINIGAWQPFGAEPISGYTAGPASLLTGLPQGFQYLAQGLLGYLNPSTYLTAASTTGLSGLLGSTGSTTTGLSSLLSGMNASSVLALGNSLLGAGSTGSSASGIASLLSALGGGSLSTLVNNLLGTTSTPPAASKDASIKSAALRSTPTSSSDASNTVAPAVVQTPHTPSTPVDKHWAPPTLAKVTPPALTEGSNASDNGTNSPDSGTNASNNGTGGKLNDVMGGTFKNLTSNGNKVELGQSFGQPINSAVSKALGGVNGGGAKDFSSHRK